MLGVLCIALVLMSSLAQAAHFHAGQPDHECALCLAIHHVPRVSAAIGLEFSCRTVASLAAPRALPMPVRKFFSRLTTRPPPVDPTFPA